MDARRRELVAHQDLDEHARGHLEGDRRALADVRRLAREVRDPGERQLAVGAAEPAQQVAACGRPTTPRPSAGAGRASTRRRGPSGPTSRPRRRSAGSSGSRRWRPSSISCLAATGASRKRCCETTDRRTPAARQAATISAHSVGGLGHRLLDQQVPAGRGRRERLGAGGRPAARRARPHRRRRGPASASRSGSSGMPKSAARAVARAPPVTALSDVPAAWLAATSAQVRPMKPEPTMPTRTVMRRRPAADRRSRSRRSGSRR